jgi:hypothetical protein
MMNAVLIYQQVIFRLVAPLTFIYFTVYVSHVLCLTVCSNSLILSFRYSLLFL